MQSKTRNEMPTLRTERLPLNFEEITTDWLTRTLQLQYPDLIVNNMEVVEIITGHTTKVRVKLDLNQAGIEAGIPRHVCFKANWSGYAIPASRPVCVTEARFYKMLRMPNILSIPAPGCYFADWDDDGQGQQGIVLIDDLIELGGTFQHSYSPIDVDEVARSLEGLAAMHGSSWGSEELDRQNWLETNLAPETVGDDYWSMIPWVYETHNAEYAALFPKWMANDPSRPRKAFDTLRLHESGKKGPRCLIHGDSHLGNSCLMPDGKRLWFDWQIVRRGLPWRDVTYFMIGSLSIGDRRKAESDLLRHYLDHFAANGGQKFTFDEAWNEYRCMVIWGIWAWLSNINPGEKTAPPLERFCTAAKDLETHKVLDL